MKKISGLIMTFVAVFIGIFLYSTCINEPAVADKSSEINAARENLKKAQSEIDEIKNKLSEIKDDRSALMEKKSLLDEQIAASEEQIRIINSSLSVIEEELEEKGAQLAVVQDEYDATMVKFRARARASYEAGTQTYLEAILSAEDLSTLLTKIDLVEAVAEYDSGLLNDLSAQASEIKVIYDEIADRKDLKEEELETQAKAEAELVDEKRDLQSTLSDLAADKEELEEQEQYWTEKEAAYEKEIAKLADTSKTYYGDEFCWPVPSSSSISSKFGYRSYTYHGKVVSGFHHAIDIAAAHGAKVVAAGNGYILKCGWVTTGGGNQIVVDHGSQLLTYYNHLSGFAVSKGQSVSRGQTIGYVGMTGTATGNHLDFAIMYKGNYQNPSLYVNYKNSKPTKSIKDLIGG